MNRGGKIIDIKSSINWIKTNHKFLYLLLGFSVTCMAIEMLLMWHGFTLMFFDLIVVGVSLPFFIASLIMLFFQKTRHIALKTIISISMIFFCMCLLFVVHWDLRRHAFTQVAHRASPLIIAIKTYEKKYESPPPSLKMLVPTYISKIPSTGMKRYPTYNYGISKNGKWGLTVDAGLGVLNWDLFIYDSSEDYSELAKKASIELIGNWAYIHE